MQLFTNILLLFALLGVCSCKPAKEKEQPVREKIIFLKKANDDLVSFCKCGDGHITYPPQIGCPWCGCGWLFTCIKCRKAFTFAQGVEIEGSWEELARRDIANRNYKPLTDAEVAHWIEVMKRLLADVKPGRIYVCIDGNVFERDARNIEFDGWYGHHSFEQLPQVSALTDPSVRSNLLGSETYWKKQALKKP